MPSYKDRVASDLDRWIAAGLAPADNRAAMLAQIPDDRRLDAAQTLAWVGAVLAATALLAFIGANWNALPRLAQFAVVLTLFGASAGGAAWCAARARPGAANGLLTFAAVAFSAAVGLTGQIFDITGDARSALYASGVAGAGLALAARASGPAIVALLYFVLGDYAVDHLFDTPGQLVFAWSYLAAPAGAALAMRWRSNALAHGAALALAAAAVWMAVDLKTDDWRLLIFAAAVGALAAAARWRRERDRIGAGVLYGWLVWAAMGFYVAGGFDQHGAAAIAHRFGWLVIGGALVALGRHDRAGAVTAAGILSLIGGVSFLMYDLGLGLLTASAMFFVAALIAVVAALALRRRRGP